MSGGGLSTIDALVAGGGDADDVLRAIVAALAAEPGAVWAGVLFLDEGALVLGPEAGTPDPGRRVRVPVSFQDTVVGELAVDGISERVMLERVAERISAHVLLGWDTGGEVWEP